MALRDLLARIRIQTQGTQEAKSELRGIGDAAEEAGNRGEAGLGRLDRGLERVRLGAVAVIGAVAGVATAFVRAASEGATFAQDLDLTSRALGLTLSRTRELERGLNRTGQDLSDLRGIVAGLRSAVGEALRGNETYAESLRGIGLEVSSLAGLDTPALLREITQAVIDLEDVSAAEFSFLANLLGDDDAARIVAAAGDIKQALLTELTISDQEVQDALRFARWKSDAENIGQDIQLGIATGLGSQDSLGEWRRQQLDLGRLFREESENEQIDFFERLAALNEDYEERAGGVWSRLADAAGDGLTLQEQRTRVRLAEIQRHFDQFGTSAGGVWARLADEGEAYMRRLVLATEQAVREANARLRALSLTTPDFDVSPAGLRSRGLNPADLNNEQNFLDIVRGNNLEDAFEAATGQPVDDGSAAPEPEDQDIYQSGAVL